ncbi:uncharacterized protein LOC108485047 [Gossypium arboreum]|uniref:uncharacterized protein LOC108485047 n=1 Tax=Gossypium arboreum TaxID=29729 RepID=UPI00081963C4|nr:uncharacterized protein LOC108485047 [Gossypium arboreum]
MDKYLFWAMAQFWNPAYSCFTFGKMDLVPTVEEYTVLLRCLKVQVDKVYSKATSAPSFVKKLKSITGISEQWVTARIQQKGDGRCIPWVSLRDLIVAHPHTKRKVDIFALSIYGLVIFPKALRHIDEAIPDFFDRLDKGVTPVPVILVETFRSLSACRRVSEGRFIGCAQLLLAWFHSDFWKVDKVSYQVFSESYSPLKDIAAMSRRNDISEENWIALLRNFQEEDVEWRAPWFVPDEILYQCGSFDWVPLLGIWSRQFISMTHGLAQSEFTYKEKNYKKKVQEIFDAWKQMHRMKRLAVGSMKTPEYKGWLSKRVNDNIPMPSLEDVHTMEEYLQKLEAEKLREGKRKVEEDLDSLKIVYKKLGMSMRTTGLGKTSEQW